jgi:hypothetical protein
MHFVSKQSKVFIGSRAARGGTKPPINWELVHNVNGYEEYMHFSIVKFNNKKLIVIFLETFCCRCLSESTPF